MYALAHLGLKLGRVELACLQFDMLPLSRLSNWVIIIYRDVGIAAASYVNI